MATTTKKSTTTKEVKKKEVKEKETKSTKYILTNDFFPPIVITKEHYEELKKTSKLVEAIHEDATFIKVIK